MHDCRQGLLFWPPRRQLGIALLLGLADGALFALVYGGAAWMASRHAHRVSVHSTLDLEIPLVPAAAVAYLSVNALLWLAPFVLRTRRQLLAYAATLAAATVTAGACFFALPVADAFPSPQEGSLGRWAGVFVVANSIATRHNFLPSLHVAFTTICVFVYSASASALARLCLAAWGAGIIASTMLIHQHYLCDVASGLLLGWGCVQLVYRPRQVAPGAPGAETPPASAGRQAKTSA